MGHRPNNDTDHSKKSFDQNKTKVSRDGSKDEAWNKSQDPQGKPITIDDPLEIS